MFGCNFLGIVFGLYTLKLFSVKKLDWIYKRDKKIEEKFLGNCSMLSWALTKFKPVFFLKHDWKVFASPGTYIGVVGYITQVMLVDLGNFFAKFVLAVPPNHDLLKVRLFIMAHIAVSSSEEQFEYINNKYVKWVGPHAWTGTFLIIAEWIFIIKNHHIFSGNPFPEWIVLMWIGIFMSVLGGFIYVVYINWGRKKEPEWNPYDPDLDIDDGKNKKD